MYNVREKYESTDYLDNIARFQILFVRNSAVRVSRHDFSIEFIRRSAGELFDVHEIVDNSLFCRRIIGRI